MEFDIAYETPDGSYTLENLPILDNGTTCSPLSQCMEEILLWTDKNPNHFPLFILMDPDFDENHCIAHTPEDWHKFGGHIRKIFQTRP